MRRDEWGCERRATVAEPTLAYQSDKETVQYWNCPVRFIPNSILSFLNEFMYYKNMNTAPPIAYRDLCPKYREAAKMYESFRAEGMRMKHG